MSTASLPAGKVIEACDRVISLIEQDRQIKKEIIIHKSRHWWNKLSSDAEIWKNIDSFKKYVIEAYCARQYGTALELRQLAQASYDADKRFNVQVSARDFDSIVEYYK